MTRLLYTALLAAALLTSWPVAGHAQLALLTRDVASGVFSSASEVEVLAAVGERLVFSARTTTGSRAWFSTDGSFDGTVLLWEGCGWAIDCRSIELGSLGDRWLLHAGPGLSPASILVTDGTRAGTTVFPSPVSGQRRGDAVQLGSSILFEGWDAPVNPRLVATDGTPGGTYLLGPSSVEAGTLTAFDPFAFFVAVDTEGGRTLWRTDGTNSGTRPLTEVFGPQTLVAVANGVLDIEQAKGPGHRVHVIRGETREPLLDLALRTPYTPHIGAGRGHAAFREASAGTGDIVWLTDGSASGTVTTGALPGRTTFDANLPPSTAWIDDHFIFELEPARGKVELWAANAETGAATSLLPRCRNCREWLRLWSLRETLLFDYGGGLWGTDGTPEGTVQIAAGQVVAVHSAGDRAYVVNQDPSGVAVFLTDGTESGTRRLAALGRSLSVSGEIVAAGNQLYLPIEDRASGGSELWALSLASGEARRVRDLAPTLDDPQEGIPSTLTATPAGVVFTAGTTVWKTAGSPASTQQVGELPCAPLGLRVAAAAPTRNGALLGCADEPGIVFTNGAGDLQPVSTELALQSSPAPVELPRGTVFPLYQGGGNSVGVSDGTADGTRALAPRGRLVGSDGELAYFLDGSYEGDLWATDGTSTGTRRLTDWKAGGQPAGWAAPLFALGQAVAVRGRTVFVASIRGGPARLWATDDSPRGAAPLTLPLPEEPLLVPSLATFEGKLLFAGRVQGRNLLWRFDLDSGQLVELAEVRAQTSQRDRPAFVPFDRRLYFVGWRGEPVLWQTDGTPEGTRPVRSVTGDPLRWPRDAVAAGGRLFVGAWDTEHGVELWEVPSAGEPAERVHDLAPESLSSVPSELVSSNSHLFFTADDGVHGREVFSLPLDDVSGRCRPAEFSLCLQGRFRVEVAWRDRGVVGRAQAVPLSTDTGYFWFFDPDNVEVVVKVLDGTTINDWYWVFYGALSDTHYFVTVTDAVTGITRRYENPAGRFASVGDTMALRDGASAPVVVPSPSPPPVVQSSSRSAAMPCEPTRMRLCLSNGRFAVSASWRDFGGRAGPGIATELTADTGTFWFFDEANRELIVKVLDAREINGAFWVFYGALTNVEFELTVEDTATGDVKIYRNPPGQFASVGDTAAFVR